MKNKNALIIGIRNEESVCTAIAQEIKRAGYTIYATYQDESTRVDVQRVAENLGIKKTYQYDARNESDLEHLAESMQSEDIALDILVHGISYSTAQGAKLNLPLLDVTWEEFTDAVRVGAFSLVELTGKLMSCFKQEASILALTLNWSRLAIPNFNVVGAAKAALESIIRGLAQSAGKAKRIKVNGISPGYVHTYSLSKIGNSLQILERAKQRSPLHTNVTKADISSLALSILENNSITGTIYIIDTGSEIMGQI
ncbi:MAG: SDR family oxidoreductase [Desulfobacteraceae bacterium]|nr:SDR family oxidoreductase [Desulfobacteraceae bacterium]